MKILKKFFLFGVLFLVFFSLLAFSSCKKENSLVSYVSDLRCNQYYGKSENFSLSASYGFREKPFISDGKVGERVYALKIKLLNKILDPATYYVSFMFDGISYSGEFALSQTGGYVAEFEIENFFINSFTVNLSVASTTETITLSSTLPPNTLTFDKALDSLSKTQSELILAYTENGEFTAEIYARIIVKDDKPYWYIGFAKADGLKAFLIDGFSGEVLAIRSVF